MIIILTVTHDHQPLDYPGTIVIQHHFLLTILTIITVIQRGGLNNLWVGWVLSKTITHQLVVMLEGRRTHLVYLHDLNKVYKRQQMMVMLWQHLLKRYHNSSRKIMPPLLHCSRMLPITVIATTISLIILKK